MKKTLLLLIFAQVFINCNNSSRTELLFTKESTIKGKQVLKNDLNIIELNYVDNFIIASLRNDKNHVKVFSSTNLAPIGKYFNKGNGPNEYSGPLAFCGSDSNNMFMYDINSYRFYSFSFNNNFKEVMNFEIKQKFNFKKPFFIDSTKIISNSSNLGIKMYDLSIYNYKKDSITLASNVISRPKSNFKKRNINYILNRYNHLLINSMSIKPDKSKVALASFLHNRIDILDTNGRLEHTISDIPSLSKSDQKEFLESKKYIMLPRYYKDIFSSNKLIYALFKAKSLIGIDKFVTKSEIRIFDWNGVPFYKINIQDDLTNFTVDIKNKIIYGIDFNNEKILSYNIKNIFNEL